MLDPPQIAKPFLADRAHEGNAPGSLNIGVIEGADHAKNHRKTTTIVADAGSLDDRTLARRLHARLLRKHRVEMRRKDEMRAGRQPGPLAEHVSRAVDAHLLQTECL